jgi:hypothetical protein
MEKSFILISQQKINSTILAFLCEKWVNDTSDNYICNKYWISSGREHLRQLLIHLKETKNIVNKIINIQK